MVEACHVTTPEGFLSIMEDGMIVPVGLRADDDNIRSFCEDDIRELTETPGLHYQIGDIPHDAQRELTEYFIANRPWYPNRAGNSRVHSFCIEVMFGYGMGVLLHFPGVGNEFRCVSQKMFGFCFNAEELFERGALIIKRDTFMNRLAEILIKEKRIWKSAFMVEEFLGLVKQAHEETEISVREVDSLPKRGYMFWWGPLPVDGAVRIYENEEFPRCGEGW